MKITHNLTIDLQRRGNLQKIDVVQGDTYTRLVNISLYNNGVLWDVPTDSGILVRYHKPDGTSGIYEELPDGSPAGVIEENNVLVTLAPQMLTAPGKVPTQVSIVVDDQVLSTFSFAVDVEEDPSKGAVGSENYYNWKSAFIPQTTDAHVGQYLEISKVDSHGRIEEVKSVVNPAISAELAAGEAKRIAKNAEFNANEALEAADVAKNLAIRNADDIATLSSSKLPQVTGAKVGQYIKITEVDELGRVVAFEAVNAPTSGFISGDLEMQGDAINNVGSLSFIGQSNTSVDGFWIQSGAAVSNEDGSKMAVAEFYSSDTDDNVVIRNVAPGVEDRDAVNLAQLSEKISQPTGEIKVGQTIVVKELNENGIPVAWETKDFPSGGNVENGEDGFSPIAKVEQTATGAVISITDKDGTTTATITNGKDGKDGADGAPGEKGDKGDKGDPGEPGQKGEHGEQGIQGIPGEKGEKGDTGAPGADGVKGDKGDKGDTGSTGATGQRGTGLLSVTTAPSSYTTAVGGITPKYRMAISTIKTQAGVTEVLLGDTIRYSYYQYPIAYLDASYAYCTTRISIRGATGAAGKDYSFDPTVYRLPILYLTGDTTGMTKETEVTLSYECNDKDGTAKTGSCTMKWQGSSSLAWDKKNYTIKFDNAFEVVDGWGSQKKYCLKANWIDHSHSRNVVSAKLWGLIRKNRSNLNSKLKALPNAGAIDGFPVIIMLNDEFHGLYSFNIPKDAWMFGMGSGTKEAIVTADNQATDTAFKGETLLDAEGLELEYNSSGFSATAVKDSFNTLINACINSFGGDLDTEVAKYLDWESAIDYYIFTVIIKGGDMIQKNAIYATFDGVKWYFSAYDMDTTYGLSFDGSALDRAVSNVTFVEAAESHRVFELIKRFKTNELKTRYNELRANALSETRICQYFENYAWDISSPILVEEAKKWPSVRGSSVNGIDQICRWVRQRLEVTDKWINDLPAQETPVEPEKPVEMVNQVPISTDTDGTIYNGTGYKDNVRLSSSGGVSGSAQTGSVVTGFIPYSNLGIIRIKGATWAGISADEGHYYINAYDASKTFMINIAASDSLASTVASYDATTGVTTFDFSKLSTENSTRAKFEQAAFIRLNAKGKGKNLIVTVNQEIT